MTASKVATWLGIVATGCSILASINYVAWNYYAKPRIKEVVIEVITEEKQNKPGSYRTMYAAKEGINKADVVDSNVATARDVRMLNRFYMKFSGMLEEEEETKSVGIKLRDKKLHYMHTDGEIYRPQFVDSCDCYKFLNNFVQLERTK